MMKREDGCQGRPPRATAMEACEKRPEIQKSGSFQEDALDEFQAVSHGVEQREVLEDFRHAGDGRGEAGEHDHGHQQQESSHNSLLKGLGEGGNAQPRMAAAVTMKSSRAAESSQMEPWKGMRNQNMATSTTKTACMIPVTTEAVPLPSRISPGVYGATRSWSKVPSSRSRAMESAPERWS